MPAGLFEAADGPVMITVTTDRLFRRLAEAVFRRPDLADDPAFATNAARMENREALTAAMNDILKADTRDGWIARMRAAGIPGGPVRNVAEAFASEEMALRGMVVTQAHSALGEVRAVRSPVSLSGDPGARSSRCAAARRAHQGLPCGAAGLFARKNRPALPRRNGSAGLKCKAPRRCRRGAP